MLRCLYILLFLVFTFSCVSKKNTDSKLSVSSLENTTVESKNDIGYSSRQTDSTTIFDEFDFDITILDFDTSVAPDSLGRYPMKRKQEVKAKRKTNTEKQSAKEEDIKDKSVSNFNSNENTNIDQSDKEKSSSNMSSPFNLNWLWFIIVPVVLFFVYKKIKTIYQKIL